MTMSASSRTVPGAGAILALLVAGVVGLFLAAPASVAGGGTPGSGGAAQDLGWLPWVGCWSPVAGDESGPAEDLVCVRLIEGEQGARISTVHDREIVSERILLTDGRRHAVAESGCEGWEEATWSDDAGRLFLRSEMTCGETVHRVTTGIFALSPTGEWIDIQSVRVGERGGAGVGTRRFQPVSAERIREAGLPPFPTERELAARTARIHATAPLDLDDVVEASGHVDPAAVQVLLLESDSRFALSAETLLALQERGVAEEVIDVVVAVTFPDRFQVDGLHGVAERPVDRERSQPPVRRGFGYDPFRPFAYRGYYDPFFFDPFFYSGLHFGIPYRGGFRGGPVVVVPVRTSPQPPGGRVIQGRGYTRGSQGTASPSRTRTPPRNPPRAAPAPRGNPPSASGGSSRVSPRGDRDSGRQDTGRRARPRGGDGGGGL